MWELLRELWGSLLGAGLALGVLITLALVAVFGAVQIYESHPWVLYLELVAVFGVLVLEVERFVRDFLREWRKASGERRKG